MMRKRLLCVALTLALLCSAQLAAAAAGNTLSMIIEAETNVPIIEVTVPSYGSVYINPFELPVEIDGDDVYEQIVSETMFIASESNVPIDVDLKVTGRVNEGSTMQLAASSARKSTTKSAFIYFEIQSADSDKPRNVEWDEEYDPSNLKHIRIQNGATTTRNKVLTLNPMTPKGKVAEGGYAAFRLTGDASENPSTPWNEEDGINVTIAYTFTPVSYV